MQKNRIPMKSINKTNKNYRKYSQFGKNVQAKHYLRGQIWGQANFWSQAKNLFGANFEAKIGVKSTLRPDKANGARPGFIVWQKIVNFILLNILIFWVTEEVF